MYSPFKFSSLQRYVVALSAMLITTALHAETVMPKGGHIIFAVGYGTDEQKMNNYVLIGDYAFTEKAVTAKYTEFDANADSKPRKAGSFHHDLQAPYGKHSCEDKIFEVPTESAQRELKGNWTSVDSALKITIGKLTYEWNEEAKGEGAYKLARITDNNEHQELPLAVGFAYVSQDTSGSGKLKKKNFFPYYNGEIFHKNNNAVVNTPWQSESSGLKVGAFTEQQNGDLLSYSSMGTMEKNGPWVANGILLNYEKKSHFVIFQDLGHDFNKNGCYDEYGHNKVIIAANDSLEQIIHHMVYVEYSYAFDGFPMLSVGRYYKTK